MQETSTEHESDRRPPFRGRMLVRSRQSGRGYARRSRLWLTGAALSTLALGVAGGISLRGADPAFAASDAMQQVEEVAPLVELPIEVNARVEKWMRRFTTNERPTFEAFLAREGIYADMIRAKLRERGMPEDLLYLAMIESGFSARATSRLSAAGVWQFMTPTAEEFGLRIDQWVDERRDPIKATDAALGYLQWLHARYGSWYLAAAAYNAGPSRVDRALERHAHGRRGDETLYWEIIDHLPRETREYVPKILAATTLARQAEFYGFRVEPAEPYRYDRVWVPGGTSLVRLARALALDVVLLRDLNPHLVRGVTPPASSFGLRVPEGTSEMVIVALGLGGGLVSRATD